VVTGEFWEGKPAPNSDGIVKQQESIPQLWVYFFRLLFKTKASSLGILSRNGSGVLGDDMRAVSQ
jgi:hypothetical protein